MDTALPAIFCKKKDCNYSELCSECYKGYPADGEGIHKVDMKEYLKGLPKVAVPFFVRSEEKKE